VLYNEILTKFAFQAPRQVLSMRWTASEHNPTWERTLWLSGAVGTGKSSVANSIAKYFHSFGRLGASFCFSRHDIRPETPGCLATSAITFVRRPITCSKAIDDGLIARYLCKPRMVQIRRIRFSPVDGWLGATREIKLAHHCNLCIPGMPFQLGLW
jgi:hypothetical protein